ncbi:MAG: DUF2252 domain-containing protein [Chitinophagaceae bacterium]|jgi:uncharacterized protein (DUF2252 family)|nr:DUF2252 domain-containing protein [Chitinophagaceae bacterium]
MTSVFKKIIDFNADRNATYVKLKMEFMSQNAFRFFRGTDHLFYEDLSKHAQWQDDTKAWICGDLHLENFGSYKGSNGVVYFDLNDFDEALLAPATWELVRLLTSIYVAARSGEFAAEFSESLCDKAVTAYLQTLKLGKAVIIEKETAKGLLKHFLEQVQLRKQKNFVAQKLVFKKNKASILIDKVKTYPLENEQKEKLIRFMSVWLKNNYAEKNLEVLDAVHRVAGTGSVGLDRYAFLTNDGEKYSLLDLKEARPSSVAPYVNIKQPKWNTEAQRIVTLQNRIQQVSPNMLNYLVIDNKSFVLKTLQPAQDRVELSTCKNDLTQMSKIVLTMGQLTASGQLRSSGRQKSSVADSLIALANNSEEWLPKLKNYAKNYAAKVQANYTSYTEEYAPATSQPLLKKEPQTLS